MSGFSIFAGLYKMHFMYVYTSDLLSVFENNIYIYIY